MLEDNLRLHQANIAEGQILVIYAFQGYLFFT